MLQYDWCVRLAEKMRAQLIIAGLIADHYIAVQCTLFEKSRDHNWLVAPHQDLSIPVTRRIDHRR